MVDTSSSNAVPSQRNISETQHVVFLHSRLRKRLDDRYMLDLARVIRNNGHKVTVYTSEFDPINCLDEVNVSNLFFFGVLFSSRKLTFQPLIGDINVRYSGWWLPKRFTCLKAILMALRMIFFPPSPKPNIVFLDIDSSVLFLFAKLSKYKTIYLNHFTGLRHVDNYSAYMKITSDLVTAKTLKYANEIFVQSKCIGDVFKRSFPKIKKELKYFPPLVDVGLWLQEKIDVKRIVPDLPRNSLMFVVFGDYCRRSNIKLVLDAFENLLQMLDTDLRDRVHLVVAAFCSERSVDQRIYYNELTETTKEKYFASQVTFLRQLPTLHKRTLIEESIAVLHPIKHDPFPDTVLAAMRIGRPIIATNTGFPQEILTHRISGILVEADHEKFASAMHKILTNPTTRMFVSDMARDIFRTQFSFETTSRRLDDIMTKHRTVTLKNLDKLN